MSSNKAPKILNVTITKPYWIMLVDARTRMKWSNFYATKEGMVEPTCEQFHCWKEAGMPVKVVRCDNGGENKKLEQWLNCVEWKLDMSFKWTARATLQQNSPVEAGLATIRN